MIGFDDCIPQGVGAEGPAVSCKDATGHPQVRGQLWLEEATEGSLSCLRLLRECASSSDTLLEAWGSPWVILACELRAPHGVAARLGGTANVTVVRCEIGGASAEAPGEDGVIAMHSSVLVAAGCSFAFCGGGARALAGHARVHARAAQQAAAGTLLSPPGGLGTTAWARRKAVAGLAAAECAPRPSGRFAPPVETRLRALAKSVAREEQARRARPGRGARKPARGGAQGGAAARVAEAVAALGMSAVVQREGARGAAGGAHEGSEGGGGDLYLAYLPSGEVVGVQGASGKAGGGVPPEVLAAARALNATELRSASVAGGWVGAPVPLPAAPGGRGGWAGSLGCGATATQHATVAVRASLFLRCGVGVGVDDHARASVAGCRFAAGLAAFQALALAENARLDEQGNVLGEGVRPWFNERRPWPAPRALSLRDAA